MKERDNVGEREKGRERMRERREKQRREKEERMKEGRGRRADIHEEASDVNTEAVETRSLSGDKRRRKPEESQPSLFPFFCHTHKMITHTHTNAHTQPSNQECQTFADVRPASSRFSIREMSVTSACSVMTSPSHSFSLSLSLIPKHTPNKLN